MSIDPRYLLGQRAHAAVRRAVVNGELAPARERQCADCGKQATEYDHRDYCRPTVVQPVCHSCNVRRGAAMWSFTLGSRPPPAEVA